MRSHGVRRKWCSQFGQTNMAVSSSFLFRLSWQAGHSCFRSKKRPVVAVLDPVGDEQACGLFRAASCRFWRTPNSFLPSLKISLRTKVPNAPFAEDGMGKNFFLLLDIRGNAFEPEIRKSARSIRAAIASLRLSPWNNDFGKHRIVVGHGLATAEKIAVHPATRKPPGGR